MFGFRNVKTYFNWETLCYSLIFNNRIQCLKTKFRLKLLLKCHLFRELEQQRMKEENEYKRREDEERRQRNMEDERRRKMEVSWSLGRFSKARLQ